jgi:diguanylate cyclase (GGDEF)-like protein
MEMHPHAIRKMFREVESMIDGGHRRLDRLEAYGSALAVFVLLFGSAFFAAHGFIQRGIASERSLILLKAANLRARLESEFSSRISLERGFVSYITLNPGMGAEDFSAFARSLVNGDPIIRNISILKGTVISFVYPRSGNESALGRDLAKVPAQSKDVLFVRDTGGTIVAGPIDLVQGGRGIVSRMAIFSQGGRGEKTYWGQASIVIASDRLFAAAGTFSRPDIRIALRNAVGGGNAFEGDPAIFDSNPVLMEITFPGGSWTLAAMPAKGWWNPATDYIVSLFVAAMAAAVMSLIAGAFVSAKARMKTMAYHDPLTGLPNRVLFWDRLYVSLALSRRQGMKVTLCMVDLDGFKEINDSFGHAAGDELLAQVAKRLSSCMRESDTVARIGGDEFAILTIFDPVQGPPDGITDRVLAEFRTDFTCAGKSFKIGASMGLAIWPDDGEDPERVLAIADERMYAMKRGSTVKGQLRPI